MITWKDLFKQGTLIDASVHLWRARIQLRAEDLGIDTQDVQKALSLGCHRLAPTESFEEINSIVGQFQRDIEDHSFEFPLLKGVRYVPDNQVKPLQKKLLQRLREFNFAVETFLSNYDDMINERLPTIEKALKDAAKTPEAALAAFSRVTREYPPREKIAKKFGLEWNFFTIALPSSKRAAVEAKSALPQVRKAVSSIIEQLRDELSSKVSTLITLAEKSRDGVARAKDGFGNKSKQSALEILDKVDRMNIFDDDVLKDQTRMLRSLLEDNNMNTVASDLKKIQRNLESDVKEAAEAAEKKLTGLGKRKIKL